MSSVTSHIELKKCYCVIIAVGGELKCKIKTGGDYLEQSGNKSTLQEAPVAAIASPRGMMSNVLLVRG